MIVANFDTYVWQDIYVDNDTNPSILFRNNHNGTFTDISVIAGCAYDENGKAQSGMGVAAGDYDCDGWLDIFKTNYHGEAPNLYRNQGLAIVADMTSSAGTGVLRGLVGCVCGFCYP